MNNHGIGKTDGTETRNCQCEPFAIMLLWGFTCSVSTNSLDSSTGKRIRLAAKLNNLNVMLDAMGYANSVYFFFFFT